MKPSLVFIPGLGPVLKLNHISQRVYEITDVFSASEERIQENKSFKKFFFFLGCPCAKHLCSARKSNKDKKLMKADL